MGDPFSFSNPTAGPLPGFKIEQVIKMNQERRARAIDAYRNNIAVDDMYVITHRLFAQPVDVPVVGEDGQPLTPERRRQIMAGKPTMAEDADFDYRTAFDDIESEPLGRTAESLREGIRIVRPLDEDRLRPPIMLTERIAYEYADRSVKRLCESVYAVLREMTDDPRFADVPTPLPFVIMSESVRQLLAWLADVPTHDVVSYWGSHLCVDPRAGDTIYFEGNAYHEQTAGLYGSIQLSPELFDGIGIAPPGSPTIAEGEHDV